MRPTDIRDRLKDAALWDRANDEPLPEIQRRIVAMRRRTRLLRATVVSVALCGVVIGAIMAAPMGHDDEPSAEIPLSGSAGATGVARVFERDSGFEVQLSVESIPMPPPGSMFEVWLVADDHRFHLGSVKGPGEATMWSAVDPSSFDAVSVRLGSVDGATPTGVGPAGELSNAATTGSLPA